MKKVNYDERIHAVYAKGRALPEQSIQRWLDGFATYLPAQRPLRLVDVGSGTGRFAPHLADRFGGPIIGVEPSDHMRERAQIDAAHANVDYRAGSAESMPLDPGSVDGALLFFAWHHVIDRHRAAAELHRVVRGDGSLLIRTQLADAMPELWWYQHSEAARRADQSMYLRLGELRAEIEQHGWEFRGLSEVTYEVAPSRAAYADRLRLRALSTFEHMSSGELDALFAALDVADLGDDEPVSEVGTLLAWRAV